MLGQLRQDLAGEPRPLFGGHAVSTFAVCGDPVAKAGKGNDTLHLRLRVVAALEALAQRDEIQPALGGPAGAGASSVRARAGGPPRSSEAAPGFSD
ncbi:hypothetical protein [Burkholderia pseudomallei]|nr:hypothetical protein [Burkholderia pseudomallei]